MKISTHVKYDNNDPDGVIAKEIEESVTCEACGHSVGMHADDDICYSCQPMNQVCGKTN